MWRGRSHGTRRQKAGGDLPPRPGVAGVDADPQDAVRPRTARRRISAGQGDRAAPPGRSRTSAKPPKNSPPYAPAAPVNSAMPVPSGFLLQPVTPMPWVPFPLATPSSVVPALANSSVEGCRRWWRSGSPDWTLKLDAYNCTLVVDVGRQRCGWWPRLTTSGIRCRRRRRCRACRPRQPQRLRHRPLRGRATAACGGGWTSARRQGRPLRPVPSFGSADASVVIVVLLRCDRRMDVLKMDIRHGSVSRQ